MHQQHQQHHISSSYQNPFNCLTSYILSILYISALVKLNVRKKKKKGKVFLPPYRGGRGRGRLDFVKPYSAYIKQDTAAISIAIIRYVILYLIL